MTYPLPHPYPPAPTPDRRRWWQHPALIIPLLVIVPPVGITLVWLSRWKITPKIISSIVAGAWMIAPFVTDPPDKTETDAKPKAPVAAPATPSASPSPSPSPSGPPNFVGQNLKSAQAAALAAGFNSISHDAGPDESGQWADGNWKVCFQTLAEQSPGKPTIDFAVTRNEWPCPTKDGDPIPYPKMPKVVGQDYAKAQETLKPLALQKIEPQSAYTDVTLPGNPDTWTVCFQDPEEGKALQYPTTTTAQLSLTTPGTSCPADKNTKLHPDPTPPPATDDVDDSGSGVSSTGGSSSGGSGARTITPGAFCSNPGSTGVSKKGVVYTCSQGHWRR
ncbi:PASTA domain-containing protein [Streptomyces sp. DSM 116496]|uniref:PASTA domain-containing protein n=1 Tax=Streptomyces stoeckheimensis TaxID=3344656 RepID=UPI0038B3D4C6